VTFVDASLLLIAASCGWLAWLGSHNIWKSMAAAVIVPLMGILVLALAVPRSWFEYLGPIGFLLALTIAIATLVAARR
jgi:TRAP-type C4-dicarboxylate transport system permease small subunit